MTDYDEIIKEMDELMMAGHQFNPEFYQVLAALRAAREDIVRERQKNVDTFFRERNIRNKEVTKLTRQMGIWRAKAKRLEGKREAS